VARFGEPDFEVQRLTVVGTGPSLVAAGLLTEHEHARSRQVVDSPATVLTTTSVVAAWGRRLG